MSWTIYSSHMVERKIGERFLDGHVQLIVVPEDDEHSCNDCYYHGAYKTCNCARHIAGMCMPAFRSDGKAVVFCEVE